MMDDQTCDNSSVYVFLPAAPNDMDVDGAPSCTESADKDDVGSSGLPATTTAVHAATATVAAAGDREVTAASSALASADAATLSAADATWAAHRDGDGGGIDPIDYMLLDGGFGGTGVEWAMAADGGWRRRRPPLRGVFLPLTASTRRPMASSSTAAA
eukprot:TRINITY_DN3690_c0_g1_i1.p1 TRINITY_DN3690_c0_g1~~TRINITY_DN3690_c0_g1_i1.p1  ORF type:complete len:158 (-),score=43.34 TRINITY_DN3690_c0_g1_i1:721-1194(-)